MKHTSNWELKIDPAAIKYLDKIPRSDARKILETAETLPQNPYAGDIRKIKGKNSSWRRRVGNYRIFYELIPKERIILVSEVQRRTSKTY